MLAFGFLLLLPFACPLLNRGTGLRGDEMSLIYLVKSYAMNMCVFFILFLVGTIAARPQARSYFRPSFYPLPFAGPSVLLARHEPLQTPPLQWTIVVRYGLQYRST